MIYLLYGKDDFRVRRAVHDMRDKLRAADDMLDTNTSILDGRALTPGELLAHATATPFLSASRLVIVEGLLSALGEVKTGRGRKKKTAEDDPLEPWREAAVTLGDKKATPETTTLIFVEGDLSKTNAAFPMFAPIARTIEHAPLAKEELSDWIAAAAKGKGLRLEGRAVAALYQLIGPDLWTLDNELDKLAAYAGGGPVTDAMVTEVVSAAQEGKVWNLTDAITDGNERAALRALRTLLESEPAPRLSFMVVRQLRQVVIIKDLKERGARADEQQRAAGAPSFKMGDLTAIASRLSWADLRRAYNRMLEADLSVKRGTADDEAALQLLVHDLCAMMRPSPRQPARAR